MDGWIGHLHNRYLVTGASTAPAGAAARLDRLAREKLPEVWSDILDQAFGDDPSIYVIRRVEARVGLNLRAEATDRSLALSWGNRLTRSVLRTVADGEDAANLVRFADQADYVANLAADLARGLAWERWYYFAFARLRPLNTADALAALLAEHRAILARVLARLHDLGQLAAVLKHLRRPDLAALWSVASGGDAADPSSFRPLFAAALDLADRLGLWTGSVGDREALFVAFASSASQPADWRDSRQLTSVVVDALDHLAARGLIPLRPFPASRDDLDAALSGLDWLDLTTLRASLFESGPGHPGPAPDLPVRPPSAARGLTSRQRALLDDLASALTASGIASPRHGEDRSGDALRLYAALISASPRWDGDPIAPALITALIAARDALTLSRLPAEALRALSREDAPGALRTLAEVDRVEAAGAFRLVAGLGEPGAGLVATLAGLRASRSGPEQAFETRCAGVFLLLRAVLDARLPSLVRTSEFPPAEPDGRLPFVLLALAARWAGSVWMEDGVIDRALTHFSAVDVSSLDTLGPWDQTRLSILGKNLDGQLSDAPSCLRFQAALLRLLNDHRLIGGPTLDARIVKYAGKMALIGGDPTGRVRPLGRVLHASNHLPDVLASWRDVWAEATGDDVDDVVCHPDEDEATNTLSTSLAALNHGRVGDADVDLTLDLAASSILRLWAVWLRRFSGSGVPYLLDNFIRRPGRVVVRASEIEVVLRPGPMDVVLEMAGYLASLDTVSWLGRRVEFRLARA